MTNLGIGRWTSITVAALAMGIGALSGCGDDDDVTPDAAASQDAAVSQDAAPVQDASVPGDAAPGPDAGEDAAVFDPCLDPGTGSPDSDVSTSSGAPDLAGGTVPEVAYVLTGVEFFPDGTFTDLVSSYGFVSAGDTYGSLALQQGAWGMSVNLDILVQLDVQIVGALEFPLAEFWWGAGMITVVGSEVQSDLTQCASSWPEYLGTEGSFPYETGAATVDVLMIMPQEAFVALLPPEYASYASMWMSGDLPFVLHFSPP